MPKVIELKVRVTVADPPEGTVTEVGGPIVCVSPMAGTRLTGSMVTVPEKPFTLLIVMIEMPVKPAMKLTGGIAVIV